MSALGGALAVAVYGLVKVWEVIRSRVLYIVGFED